MSSMADFYIDNGIDPTDFDSFDNFVDMHTATTPTPKLNLDHVRQLAATADLKEIYCNEDSKVISFVPRSDHSPTKRINIYWTTGTVGTCVLHPKQGHTQAFRRDVTPSLLEELMLNPRMHTNTTYQRKRARGGSSSSSFRGGASTGDPADEESELIKQQMKLKQELNDVETLLEVYKLRREEKKRQEAEKRRVAAEIAKARAQAEEKKRQQRVLAEQRRQAQAEEEERRRALSRMRTQRGRYLEFWVKKSDDVDQMFDGDTCRSIATNGDATIFLYDDGGSSWTAGMPTKLHNKLNGRSRQSPSPTYVAMGSEGRYYIEFEDGQYEWVGPERLSKDLKKNDSFVVSVAFGENLEDYAIVWEDGSYSYSGIPTKAANVLVSNKNKTLLNIALGPNGEYWIKMSHMSWFNGGTEFLTSMEQNKGRDVKFVDFGSDDTYILRYS